MNVNFLYLCLIFTTNFAWATPQGIECKAPDGSYMGINYPEGKLLVKGPIFGDSYLWRTIKKSIRSNPDGTFVEYYEYHSGYWFDTSSIHILLEKSKDIITGKFRRISLDDNCHPDEKFECQEPGMPVFVCTETEQAPLPPPEPRSPELKYPVCDRSPVVREWIEKFWKKPCDQLLLLSDVSLPWRQEAVLDLSNKEILSLKDGDFEGLFIENDYQWSVDLSHNKLTSVPKFLFGKKLGTERDINLFSLNLSHNQLEDFDPPEIEKNNRVGYHALNLSYNLLDFYPDSNAFGWGVISAVTTGLTKLDLSHNRIRALPKISLVGQWTDLSSNLISTEALEAVRFEIFAGRKFRILSLKDNPLNRLPANFDNWLPRHSHSSVVLLLGSEDSSVDVTSIGGFKSIGSLDLNYCVGETRGNVLVQPWGGSVAFNHCQISLNHGIFDGRAGEVTSHGVISVIIKDTEIQELSAAELVEDMCFSNCAAKIELVGKTTINTSALEKLKQEVRAVRERELTSQLELIIGPDVIIKP